jgi:hypothetical protein
MAGLRAKAAYNSTAIIADIVAIEEVDFKCLLDFKFFLSSTTFRLYSSEAWPLFQSYFIAA